MSKGPVLIDLDAPASKPKKKAPAKVAAKPKTKTTPATAPAVVDVVDPKPTGQAMQTMAVLAARRPSILWRWFWRIAVVLVGFLISVAAWDFITALLARNPILGTVATALIVLFVIVCLFIAIRELAALSRLRRVDRLQQRGAEIRETGDLGGAKHLQKDVLKLYSGREDVAWGRDRLHNVMENVFDATATLDVTETEILKPLDTAALREIEAGARQVALVTAIVPLALADVVAALTANIRMVRRIAEIYGGRGGTFGSWRLMRTVLTHLVATGAVAVGDDLIGSVAGGGALSKISRRFGEGIINGALTARVGVAAMEVCRPLPFHAETKPKITGVVQRALTGLFSKD